MNAITVSWAEVTRDERGEVRQHYGWRAEEFDTAADALTFAAALRVRNQGGVCVMDANRNRLD